MRFLLIIFLFCFKASAKTYYVRSDGGTGDGQTDVTAWSYTMLNNSRLVAGDVVLLKRGQVFFGELKVHSGVRYGAYASGANPVISGLKTVSGWTQHAGAIYSAPLDLSASLNLVLLQGNVVGMGRYPNSGYLTYTGHKGNNAVSATAIRNLPFNATGAEAVIRKVRWILDRHPVTEHSGVTLQLSNTSPDGGYNGRDGVDKNGFFIQNHLKTLDKEGEWWYDKRAKRLFMVLSGPTQKVQVSVVERLVSIPSLSNISFTSLDFEGSSIHGVSMNGSKNISFTNCRFYHHGQTGVYGTHTTRIIISNCLISNCLNNGIWVEWGGNDTRVEAVTVNNCGTIAGAGRSGDAAQEGISIAGDNTTIKNCTVVRTGYNGIHFNGNNALIENNRVDLFCLLKDDGAGIYNFETDGVMVTNRHVRNNTVLHAVGAFAGAESYDYEAHGKVAGIYLDGDSNHTDVTGNVIAHGPWAGFFVNNNGNHRFAGNLVYGHAISILLIESNKGRIRNLEIDGNWCIGKTPLYIKLYEADDPALLGKFRRNHYSKGEGIWIDRQFAGGRTEKLQLKSWKAKGNDLDSRESD